MRLFRHVLEDLPECSDPQWLVRRNGEMLLFVADNPSEPPMAAALSGDAVAKRSELFGQVSAVEIPGNPHRVNNSCRT